MIYNGYIRRTDLALRSQFPEIETTIYRISEHGYRITCKNFSGDFVGFNTHFQEKIRPMTLPVDLSVDVPATFLEIIPPITDKEIAHGFEGMSFTKIDLLNLLIGKFPNVHFYDITGGGENLKVHVAKFEEVDGSSILLRFLKEADKNKVLKFLNEINIASFEIVEDEMSNTPDISINKVHNPVQYLYSANTDRKNTFKYAERDDAVWFDNIDNIFNGKFRKSDLYFFNPNEFSCYVDYGTFPNIDIRNHLLLFQTIYLSLPYEKTISDWLKISKIGKTEFLELISRGRIKLLLTQPEFRYDFGFIQEVYEINPSAVVTRRALAALQQIDIVELSDNYILNDTISIRELKDFCEIVGKETKVDPKFLYEKLIWPIKARRNSFELLNYSGLIGMAQCGVNTAIEKSISEALKKDLSFDFTVNSPSIHLSHSLNATYFPFKTKEGYTDFYYASVMGDLLNLYKNATKVNLKAFIENKKKLNSGILPISPIDVIEIDNYVPILEFEEILNKDTVFPRSIKLMETLANLSDKERADKIAFYNAEVNKKLSKKNSGKNVIDLGSNVLMDAAGAASGFNAIGSAFSLIKWSGNALSKKLPLLKNLGLKFEEAFSVNQDAANIHFLTKINRVARIKRQFE